MNATGTKITTSENVVAMTARPISCVASAAASFGVTPFSSTYRKIFSSTTIASSMTMPVASDSASIVMLFSVNPAIFMKVKVPTIDVGIARAAMKVTRRFRMNRKTTMLASRPPRIRCSLMSSNDRRMKRDWSLPTLIWMSCGNWAWMRVSFSWTRSTTSTVLVPDCLRTITLIAGVPLNRDAFRTS